VLEDRPDGKMVLRTVRVSKPSISYVRWLLEAHEGLATATTRPGEEEILDLLVAPDLAGELDDLLEALTEEIDLRMLPATGEAILPGKGR
jgi:hypothetical protein